MLLGAGEGVVFILDVSGGVLLARSHLGCAALCAFVMRTQGLALVSR